MPLKALTLDLWLTLIWDSKELEEYRKLRRLVNFYRFVNKIHKSRGIKAESPFKFGDVRLAIESVRKKSEEFYERGIDPHPKERGRMLFEFLNIKVEEKDKPKIYENAGRVLSNSGYMRKFPHVNPEAGPTLRAFRKSYPDLKIALISNAARSADTYKRTLNALGIGRYFDHLVISCEVGYLKPRKEIFEHALKLLDVKPKEALHIGDLFRTDVIGAVSCGMNACLYSGLWTKYTQIQNEGTMPSWAGEHLPHNFKASKGQIVREIQRLQDALAVARLIDNADDGYANKRNKEKLLHKKS
jgi:HAD superfamily hydrolase (TIGR01509 family)